MRGRHRALVFSACAALVAAACSLTTSLDGLTGGGGGGSDSSSDGLVSDGSLADGAISDASDAAALGEGGCPKGRGAEMIEIDDVPTPYCVDVTEVTNADYKAFLDSGPSTAGQPPGVCDFNTTFVPQTLDASPEWPPSAADDALPVVFIDWCDAYAYCAWAGKRLCGAIGGGPNPINEYALPSRSQWYHACSANGARVYPYGNDYDASICNVMNGPGGNARLEVDSLPGCQGGYPGLFDMSGNVEEWEDSCDDAGCLRRGGSYADGTQVVEDDCANNKQHIDRTHPSGDVGVRCCAP